MSEKEMTLAHKCLTERFSGKKVETPEELNVTGSGIHRVRLRGDYFLYFWYTELIATADLCALYFHSIKNAAGEKKKAVDFVKKAHSGWAYCGELENDTCPRAWYFTLAANQGGPAYIEVWAHNTTSARDKMVQVHGLKWAFQYAELQAVHPTDRNCKGVIV